MKDHVLANLKLWIFNIMWSIWGNRRVNINKVWLLNIFM